MRRLEAAWSGAKLGRISRNSSPERQRGLPPPALTVSIVLWPVSSRPKTTVWPSGDQRGLPRAVGPMRDESLECDPVDELHHDVVGDVFRADVVDGHNVRGYVLDQDYSRCQTKATGQDRLHASPTSNLPAASDTVFF